ncbi:MAG: sugar phosphate isomerase/epimerase [Sedimentisphaerales bacterium]|nr:sugar phosphate isomerase/epimerase [Sedimentisphaerales bacterium]
MSRKTRTSIKLNWNRRGFLKAAGLGAATAAAGFFSAVSAKEKPGEKKWSMRLSTSSIHFMQLPIEQACERIAKLGFEAVDIWSAHEGCPHLDDVLERLGPEGLKQLLAKHKLKLFAFSVYSGGYRRYADLLGKAGGGVAVRGSTGAVKPGELTARTRQFIESLKPLVELAEQNNSYLAIENHGDALLNTPDSFKAFVDNNKSKRLGIALAPYHLQAIKASVPDVIRIAGKQLFFFYAWQHQPGDKQLPGVGPTDMSPWIEALARVRYRGCVNPFMHGHRQADLMAANLATSRDYLKDCYSKLKRSAETLT